MIYHEEIDLKTLRGNVMKASAESAEKFSCDYANPFLWGILYTVCVSPDAVTVS